MAKAKGGAPVVIRAEEPMYKPQEVADILRVNRSWVWNLIHTGKLSAVRIGVKQARIPRSSVEAYLRDNKIGA